MRRPKPLLTEKNRPRHDEAQRPVLEERKPRETSNLLKPCYITNPSPTIGTKLWSTDPYFVPDGAAMTLLGNMEM